MKKLSYAVSAFAMGLMSTFAHADFNKEMNVSLLKADDVNVYGLGGSYYFEPVKTNKGPLAEANFLNQQSSIDAVFTRFNFDNNDLNAWAIGGTYVIQGSGLYVNAAVLHLNGFSDNNYSLGGGYYLAADWSVFIDTQFDDDTHYQGISLGSKKLFDMGREHFISVEGTYHNPDEGDDSFSIASDFYLNRNVSIGLGYEWSDKLSDGISSARTQWFVNDAFSLSAEIAYADFEGGSDTNYMLGASLRF